MKLGRVAPAALAAAAVALGGCGGDDGDEAPVAAAHRYAATVAQTTNATRRELAQTSQGADYRDAAAAATTTRAYATAIRTAADDLGSATPPASVVARHRALVELYRTSAARLDALATRFGAAPDERQLTALAQDLSGEVQALSTREAGLRAEIDAALARIAPTTPASTS